MPRWVRSLVPPLFRGLVGGAITFVVLSIATITYRLMVAEQRRA